VSPYVGVGERGGEGGICANLVLDNGEGSCTILLVMRADDLVDSQWRFLLQMLPEGIEESAVEKLAIRRRRGVESAEDLLRLALAYGVCDFSLRQTAAWAKVKGIADISDVALLKRLRGAADWLGWLVLRWLEERGLAAAHRAMRVRIVDATTVSGPGSKGVDWRLHLGVDLEALEITSIELTGPEGGETLLRHRVASGEVVLADRGYAHRRGIASVLEQGGHVLVRVTWKNLPLETRSGKPIDLLTLIETLGPAEIGDWDVQIRWGDTIYPLRLIAIRKTAAAAERERRRIRKEAKRKGRTYDPGSLRIAAFQLVVTDLHRRLLPPEEALELYRLRWQIEITFKRLKSILHIDRLRARDPDLSRAYLYSKLLGALILDELTRSAKSFFPWGFPLLPHTRAQSLALADLHD